VEFASGSPTCFNNKTPWMIKKAEANKSYIENLIAGARRPMA